MLRLARAWSSWRHAMPRTLGFVALAAAFFVAAWSPPAHAQVRADRPDLRVTTASFDGRNLHVEYVNATGVYDRRRYEVGFQWYDAAGKEVGVRHWLPQPEVERGGVAILDTKYRIDLTYRRSGSNYNRRLLDFILQRPNAAEELRVTLDDGDRIPETDETNNVARLKLPLPDLQITSAKFLTPNRLELSYRNANPSPIPLPFRIGFTWAEEGGASANATRWINVLEPAAGATETVVLSRTDASYLTAQGRQSGDRLDWYFERRPGNATRLQVTMDSEGTVREQNEQNNLVSVRPFLPDLVVRDAKFADGRLTFTYGNAGEGYIRDIASRVTFQWVGTEGKPVSEPRWSGFAQMDPGQTFTVDASRFDVTYAIPGTNRTTTQRLAAYVAQRPADATQLRITIDDEQRILESDERNNVATMTPPPSPQPDFTITDATLAADTLEFTVRNIGSGATPPGQPTSLWFEWVNTSGVRVGALAWVDARSAIASGQFLRFTGAYSRFTRVRAGGGTELLTLAEFLADVPGTATHLKVHADGPNAIRESNEANNVTLLARPVVPLSDLRIADFTVDPVAPRAGDRVWFIVRVENAGSAATGMQTATGITVDLAKSGTDRKLIGQFTAPDIASGKSFMHRWTKENTYGWVAVEGTHILEVCADRAKAVSEEDETNNCATREVTVAAVVDEKPKFPDLTIMDATLDTAALRFWIHNRGETATGPAISLWYEWVDASGARVGELRWINLHAAMPPKAKQQGNQLLDFATLDSERGEITLGEFVRGAPPSAIRLKLTIDGPNAHAESDEQNNSVLLPKPVVRGADLTIASAVFRDGELRVTVRNIGTADAPRTNLVLTWTSTPGVTMPFPLLERVTVDPVAAGGEQAVAIAQHGRGSASRMLRDLPKEAKTLRLSVDGDQRLVELREDNNTAELSRAEIPERVPERADLVVGAVEVQDGALRITARNTGDEATMPTDIWLMWFAGGRPLSASAAVDLPAIIGRAEATIVVPFDGKTEASRILRDPPKDGTRVRISLDGSRKVVESNEDNNDATLDRAKLPPPKPEPPAKPDLRVSEHRFDAERFTVVMATSGAPTRSGFNWMLEWVDAKGNRLDRGYPIYQQPITPDQPARWDEDLKTSSYGSRTYLLAPPTGATHLRVSLDVSRQVEELDETNNAVLVPRPAFLGDPGKAPESFAVRASGFPTTGEGAITVQFRADVTGGKPPHTVTWTFGDRSGETRTGVAVQYTYSRAGTYVATVTVRDAIGAEAKGEVRIEVAEERRVGPDLVIEEITMDPTAPKAGDIVTFRVRVANHGARGAGEITVTRLELDLKNDQTIDEQFSQYVTNALAAGGTQMHAWDDRTAAGYHWVAVAGTHRFVACADRLGGVEETDERNNCLERTLTVAAATPPTPNLPDLSIDRISVTPERPMAGKPFAFTGVIRNSGAATEPFVAYLLLDLGNDDDPESAPTPVDIRALHAKITHTVTWPGDPAPAGTHKVEVCADVADDIEESNEDNNCKEFTFTVSAAGANLPAPSRVAGVRIEASPVSWGSILNRALTPFAMIVP